MLCVLLIAIFIMPSTAFAVSVMPSPATPWRMELWDGLVFHMTPQGYEAYGYKPSGLYRDEALVYLVKGYARNHIHFSNDGLSFLYIASEERAWGDIPWLRDDYPGGLVFFITTGSSYMH